MLYLDTIPLHCEVLQYEAPVAEFRRVLAAKEAGVVQILGQKRFLDFAFLNEAQELALVRRPTPFSLFALIQHLLFGGEQKLMPVLDSADFI